LYITFDNYYKIKEYNKFKIGANNNKIKYEEYISIKPPFNRYLKLDKKDLPSFLNYDIIKKSEERWLLSNIKPRYVNESFYLLRREGQDNNFIKYVTPTELLSIEDNDNIIVFSGRDRAELRAISTNNESKIYELGINTDKMYKVYITTDIELLDKINPSNILMTFGTNASKGLYSQHKCPEYYLLEYYLNLYICRKNKLENKTLELSYWRNANYYPIKKLLI